MFGKKNALFLLIAVAFALPAFSGEGAALKLVQTIPIPNVTSRFDHFNMDRRDLRLFVPAEQAKVVEVIDLRQGRQAYAIPGFVMPHSIYYWAPSHELFVGDNNGTVKILRVEAHSYKQLKTVKLTLSSAGNMRFDPATQLLYIGNYRRSKTATGPDHVLLGIINVRTDRHVGDIRVPGRIMKGFAMETGGPRIFVAIKDRDAVAVINRKTRRETAQWALHGAASPYAIALDELHHRLFVVTHKPGKLIVLNSETGQQITSLPAPAGVDDAYYDAAHRRIYVSAGVGSSPQGWIAVYRQLDADHYQAIAPVSTGAASATSLLVPKLDRYYVVAQRNGKRAAEVQVYEPEP
ncbi:MAG TPA: hypothetical protein VNJ12_06525 [Candidatus Dormibacteraeota bacterium]|nr:hypothetical protein [Candidatus Dormibacteraeota bacterium]